MKKKTKKLIGEYLKMLTDVQKNSIFDFYKENFEKNKMCYISFENVKNPDDDRFKFLENIFKSIGLNKNAHTQRRNIIVKVLSERLKNCTVNNFLLYDNSIKVKEVSSLKGFFELLKEKEKNETLFFRGQSNLSWNITASVFRNNIKKDEKYFINEMIRQNPFEFNNLCNFDKLAKMQHYALPTRLIDITENPLVALYFACKSEPVDKNNDGAIFLFSIPDSEIKYSGNDEVEIFIDSIINNKKISIKNDCYFVRGNFTNERITAQDGSFIVPVNTSDIIQFNDNFHCLKELFVVTNKVDILKELEFIGISEKTLFRDIEHIAKSLNGATK